MFSRCHYSFAVVTPAKYECDLINENVETFTKVEMLLIDKLTNKALVTPTPGNFTAHLFFFPC